MDKHLGISYNLRLSPELKAKIAESAQTHNRSMNADIVARLENSLNNQDAENTAIQFGEVNCSTLEESTIYVSDFFQRHNQYRLISIETINSNGIRYWYSFPKSKLERKNSYKTPHTESDLI